MESGILGLPRRELLGILAVVAILAVMPLIFPSSYFMHLLVLALLYGVLASNWDLTLGYAGIFNWAHVTIFALGAYTAGVLSVKFGVSPWLCIVAAMIVAVVAAVGICLPVLRVKGIYVVLVTFAFGQLCLHLALGLSAYTGGSQGLVGIPALRLGDYTFAGDGKIAYFYLALGLFLVSTYYLRRVVRSNFGLSIVALRDNEEYAISRGTPLSRQRLVTFAASAIFTGATGAVFAFYLGVVSPELFSFSYTATLLTMILLGGISTIYGSLLGAFVITFISEFLVDLGPWRFLIISVIIVVVMRFYPSGSWLAIKGLFRSASRR